MAGPGWDGPLAPLLYDMKPRVFSKIMRFHTPVRSGLLSRSNRVRDGSKDATLVVHNKQPYARAIHFGATFTVPAVSGKLMRFVPTGGSKAIYRTKRKAFEVTIPAQPWITWTLEDSRYRSQISVKWPKAKLS